ncbi:putative cyclin-dependent kinase inhibitor 1-like isoform X3 [Capsicum annuum]|nr:putative cyclin-dependent kinase inhibitor 1-like isoform X3 [Capsicum annuum]
MKVAVKMKREREVLEVAETRKRKKRDADLEMLPTTVACVRSHDSGVSVAPASLELSPVSELTSQGNTTVSCKPAVSSNFADNESNDATKGSSKFLDLDEDDSVEIATSNSELRESREAILPSDLKVELHKLEATPQQQLAKCRCRRSNTEAKMPSEAELDEFFVAAEKDLHKQFAEKYNNSLSFFTHLSLFSIFYSARKTVFTIHEFACGNRYNFDFAKEEPLEGRYKWVRQ